MIQRSEHQRYGYFEVFMNHSLSASHILSTISVSSYMQCAFSCLQNVLCFSFNVATVQDINSKQYACQLLPTDKCRNPDDFVLSQEFHHYATPNPCESSAREKGTRSPLNNEDGHCADGSFGRSCHPKGWTMVFKVVNGTAQPLVGPLWDSNQTLAENGTAALMNNTANYLGHYKNRIVNNWEAFDPQKVRVVLYKRGSEVLSMSFNAVGTDKLNWFSQAKLLSSPWSDLKTARNLIHFDITGSHKRYFEITSRYGGCPNDTGWLVVSNGACPWERHGSSSSSSIRFSNLRRKTNWNNFANVEVADVLAVFIR